MPFTTVAVRSISLLAAAAVAVAPPLIAPSASADQAATVGSFTLSPTSLSFGASTVSDSKVNTIVVTNTSNGDVQVGTSYAAGPFSDAVHEIVLGDDCYSTDRDTDPPVAKILAPGDSCDVNVLFHPEVKGSFTRKVTVSLTPAVGIAGNDELYQSTDVLASKTANLTGNAALPTYTVSPTSGSYGNVTLTNAKTKMFAIKNTSKIPLMFELSQHDDFSNFGQVVPSTATDGHCQAADGVDELSWGVAPGTTCDFQIEFVPHTDGNWKATYAWKASFSIFSFRAPGVGAYQDHAASDMLVGKALNVNGTGVAPKVAFSPTALQFGTIDTNGTRVLSSKVTDKSDIPLTVRTQNYASNVPFEFIYLNPAFNDGECNALGGSYWTIAPGDSCTVRVLVQSPTKGTHTQAMQVQLARASATGGYQTTPVGQVLSLVSIKATVYGSGHPG